MMVIRRKTGEAVCIQDDIRISIHEVRHGVVRFGIEAPEHIAVHRLEVYEQVQQENKAAVSGNVLAWLKAEI